MFLMFCAASWHPWRLAFVSPGRPSGSSSVSNSRGCLPRFSTLCSTFLSKPGFFSFPFPPLLAEDMAALRDARLVNDFTLDLLQTALLPQDVMRTGHFIHVISDCYVDIHSPCHATSTSADILVCSNICVVACRIPGIMIVRFHVIREPDSFT